MTDVFIVLAISVASFIVATAGFFMALSLTHNHRSKPHSRGSK